MARADIVVVPSSPRHDDSFRVQREIDGAWTYGRPVIAVRRPQCGEGAVNDPAAVEKVVNFNPKSIIDGILEFRHVAFV